MSFLDLGPALLFCPADRPDRFEKAAARADAVILDLEDAVTPESKDQARENLVHALNWQEPGLQLERTLVRINTAVSGHQEADLEALAGTEVRFVVVPKCDSPEQLDAVAQALPEAQLIPQIETPAGVLAAQALAAHGSVAALFWGTEDLIAGLGGTSARGPGGAFRHVIRHARAHLLLAAGAHGVAAIDTIYPAIQDTTGLAQEASDAAAEGFIAKACIHPQQVETVRAAYAPEPSHVEWAKALLVEFASAASITPEEARTAEASMVGAFSFRAEMIDAPVIIQAQRILQRHSATLSPEAA
ncbi:HpcH/HpaI aldolase/citrate lyase family protein [Nesterenkonia flava]|uniref:CoA ester lyase n=1 Tax=Nesterenkonia flava TaxID=469799 RepID=A0ABU1FS83_9MICC|nr:CoA ester lyase [Nesterenkonia flava]MDR5711530.1 CoA ester lyase [Nesterenkonia flava]